jgi:hypothetical protein
VFVYAWRSGQNLRKSPPERERKTNINIKFQNYKEAKERYKQYIKKLLLLLLGN